MDQHDDDTSTPDPAEESAPQAEQDTTEPVPAATDAPAPLEDELGAADPVEAEPPARPADATPTPAAVPEEGPVAAAAHGASARPRPVAAKITPVLAAVAVAWVLKKLLTRSRS